MCFFFFFLLDLYALGVFGACKPSQNSFGFVIRFQLYMDKQIIWGGGAGIVKYILPELYPTHGLLSLHAFQFVEAERFE